MSTTTTRPLTVRLYNAGTRNMPHYDPTKGWAVGDNMLARRRLRSHYREMRHAGVPVDTARHILADLLSLGSHGQFISVFPRHQQVA